jgi:dihydromonapterin reductase/dihydrofolate reductase
MELFMSLPESSPSTKEVILLTGGAQRVGLHCALALQQAGFQLIITYRTEHPAVAQLRQAGVICFMADLTSLPAIAKLVADIAALTPTLRAVIHNASAWQKDLLRPVTSNEALNTDPAALLQQLQADAAVFDAMQQIHGRAPYLLNRALLPLLQAQTHAGGQADIIHLTDFVASVGSEKHQAYAASKAALENLTLSLARQLAPAIKVNAIAPALLMFNLGDSAEYQQQALAKSLLGVAPGPQEVLSTLWYLLQSQYITGRVLALDGGRQLRLP